MTTAAEINTAIPIRLPEDGQTFTGCYGEATGTRVWLNITPFGRVEIYIYRDGHFLNSFFVAAPHG